MSEYSRVFTPKSKNREKEEAKEDLIDDQL